MTMGIVFSLKPPPRGIKRRQCPLFSFPEEGGKMFYNSVRVKCIRADQLYEKIRSNLDFFLLDVRTPAEHLLQAIPGSYLVPVQELKDRMRELPKNREIIVYCRVGNRSASACTLLAQEGFDVKNLEGGIQAWNTIKSASLIKAS
jgi:rhodanese-related sulfurtransferase